MKSAKMAVLLISVNFMNSKYIKEIELVKLKQRYEKNDIQIIPIYISTCGYQEVDEFKWVAELQRLPENITTLLHAKEEEEELCNVVKKINESLHPEANFPTENKKKSNYKNLMTKSIIPYLVNRNRQINDMTLNINNNKVILNNKIFFKSPVIWIIHGDKFQSHYKFIDCIENYFWEKRIYQTNSSEPGIKTCMIDWPWPVLYDNHEDRKQLVENQILSKYSFYNKYQINNVFAKINKDCEKHSVLIFSDCETHKWEKYGKEKIINEFVDFWKNYWPSHNCIHPLICCLMLKYNETPKKTFIKRFFKSKNKTPTNNFIKNYIKTNCKKDGYFVIQELMDVEQIDVERWGRTFEQTIRKYWSGPDIIHEINSIFIDNNNNINLKSMPMEKLGIKLYDTFFNKKK